jgi:hypothetical protein
MLSLRCLLWPTDDRRMAGPWWVQHLPSRGARYLLSLLRSALRDHDGYTTVECGILLNLSIIFLEKVLIGL